MKKLYFLLFIFLMTALSFGQASDLYFSMYGEGSSNNKFLEIYNGTGSPVDLSNYSVILYSNGSSTATNTQTFAGGTMLADGDVYVLYNSSAVAGITANGDASSSTCNFNGDDAIALLKLGTVIDVIGQIGVDPGSYWAVGSTTDGTVNHTLVRKSNICDPNPVGLSSFGSDDATSEWTVYASDGEWGQIGSHVGCSTDPVLALSDGPANGSNFVADPETVNNANIDFATTNFDMSQDAGGGVSDYSGAGFIKWYVENTNGNVFVDGGNIFTSNDPGTTYPVTGLAVGETYFFRAELVDNDGNPLGSPVVYSFTITIAAYNDVANLAALRAGTVDPDTYYRVTGEVFNSFSRASNNQKYFQDATGGILVYDPDFRISTVYNEGDGVTNIRGHLELYNGLLEFIPTDNDNWGKSSTGGTITPEVVTIADVEANLGAYESKLVRINGVTFALGDGVNTFSQFTNYAIDDGTATTPPSTFRTGFQEANYIGQIIPTGATDMLVIVGNFNGAEQFTARSLSELSLSTKDNQIDGFSFSPNPTSLGYIDLTSKSQTAMKVGVFDILGKQVINTTVSNNRLDVSKLNTGIYIMKISQDDATTTKKLVIK